MAYQSTWSWELCNFPGAFWPRWITKVNLNEWHIDFFQSSVLDAADGMHHVMCTKWSMLPISSFNIGWKLICRYVTCLIGRILHNVVAQSNMSKCQPQGHIHTVLKARWTADVLQFINLISLWPEKPLLGSYLYVYIAFATRSHSDTNVIGSSREK